MAVTSGIVRKGGVGGVGAKIVPWQPPPLKPFQPEPVGPTRPAQDPRIQQLIEAIRRGQEGQSSLSARLSSLSQPTNIPSLNLKDLEGQSAQLRKLSGRLMRGEGIDIGDVSTDPAARAYAVSAQRNAERMREEAAARLGASGLSGSGDFDSEAAKIRELTGTNIASNLADTANRRKTEALTSALAGANLQMSDLDRQMRARQSEYTTQVELERLRREGLLTQAQLEASRLGGDQATNQRLLETLLAEEARKEATFNQERDRSRTSEGDRLSEELRRRELERALRNNYGVGRPNTRGGIQLGI